MSTIKIAAVCLILSLWSVVAYAGTVTYVYSDPQNTPLAEADASGNITARFDYTPYGVAVASMGPAPNGPGYTGHVSDPDTGLVYMQARYYDPSTGQFLSPDPVGPAPGNLFNFNRYDYASNNPINHTDPDGRCSDVTCGTMVQNYGAWANANPAEADKLGRNIGVPAVAAMLVASGAGAVVEVVEGAVVLNKALSDSSSGIKNVGRAKNKLGPVTDADAAHSTFKTGADGKISNTATYEPNAKNPSGFQMTKRVDVTGRPHTNPDGKIVPTPHVKEVGTPGVRPANPNELPSQ